MADEKRKTKTPEEEAWEVISRIGPTWLLRTLKVTTHICEGPPLGEELEGEDLPKEKPVPLTIRIVTVLKKEKGLSLSEICERVQLSTNARWVQKTLRDLERQNRIKREGKGHGTRYWAQ